MCRSWTSRWFTRTGRGASSRCPITCNAACSYTLDRLGPHGLPLIGRADWNDCLNLNCFSETPGESFQTTENHGRRHGRRVGLHRRPVRAGSRRVGGDRRAARLGRRGARLSPGGCPHGGHRAGHGWDGDWFLRAYDAFGKKVGSQECDEGRSSSSRKGCASWPASAWRMAWRSRTLALGATAPGQRAMASSCCIRLIRAITWSWARSDLSARLQGKRQRLLPHQPLDHDRRGHGRPRRQALDYLPPYQPLGPRARMATSTAASRTSTPRPSPARTAPTHGEAKNSWLTGTAAWNYVAVTQWILGIRPELRRAAGRARVVPAELAGLPGHSGCSAASPTDRCAADWAGQCRVADGRWPAGGGGYRSFACHARFGRSGRGDLRLTSRIRRMCSKWVDGSIEKVAPVDWEPSRRE